jgi:hypothetical protein
MQQIHCPNGLVLEWDDTLEVGELITAHDAGYHIVTGFEFRDGHAPLINYVMVVRDDGTKVKKPGVTRTCDATFCRRVTTEGVHAMYRLEQNSAANKRENLLNYLPVTSN